jgi:hypothetical protein
MLGMYFLFDKYKAFDIIDYISVNGNITPAYADNLFLWSFKIDKY